MTKLPDNVRPLFKPPFCTDRDFGVDFESFVYDREHLMAASKEGLGKGRPIARGWGRIQYTKKYPEACAAYDAWVAWFDKNIPKTATLSEVAELLTAAWNDKELP